MEREHFQIIIIIDEMIQLGSEVRIGVWQLFEKDDLRVYNYALSPQKVKELYDSFPVEEAAAPVGLSLTTTSPRTTLIV